MYKKMTLTMPVDLKNKLETVSKETYMSQNQLVLLAINSLIANYQNKGSFIFVDLLSVDDKSQS